MPKITPIYPDHFIDRPGATAAEKLYNAYNRSTGGLIYKGEFCPRWTELLENLEQDNVVRVLRAWEAVAEAAGLTNDPPNIQPREAVAVLVQSLDNIESGNGRHIDIAKTEAEKLQSWIRDRGL